MVANDEGELTIVKSPQKKKGLSKSDLKQLYAVASIHDVSGRKSGQSKSERIGQLSRAGAWGAYGDTTTDTKLDTTDTKLDDDIPDTPIDDAEMAAIIGDEEMLAEALDDAESDEVLDDAEPAEALDEPAEALDDAEPADAEPEAKVADESTDAIAVSMKELSMADSFLSAVHSFTTEWHARRS